MAGAGDGGQTLIPGADFSPGFPGVGGLSPGIGELLLLIAFSTPGVRGTLLPGLPLLKNSFYEYGLK